MNHYEAKQEGRRERLERAALRAREGSAAAHQRARAAVAGIEFGQPILVGHHSEGRHRAALRRQDQAMRRAVELDRLADRLAAQAASVGAHGISSDDPDAVAKLTDKRTALEVERDHMKAANAYYRKHGTLDGAPVPADVIEDGRRNLTAWGRVYRAPFPPYALQNIGARITAAAKRATQIEQTQAMDASRETIADVVVESVPTDNRVLVRFGARLSREHYQLMRSRGFVWTPSRDAFTRKLSNGALLLARELARTIGAAMQLVTGTTT